MWSVEKLGAVRSRERVDTPLPPGHSILAAPASLQLVLLRTQRLPTRHSSLACPDEGRATGFLPGSALQVECDVTHSKQSIGQFLPGATTARQLSSNWRKFSPEFIHGPRVAPHGSRLLPATRHSSLATEFLTGSGSQTEIDVTHSKQRTGSFLTGARTAVSRHQVCRDFRRNCTCGTRTAGHGARSGACSLFCPPAAQFAIMHPARTSPARLAT
jgi:hypothetical protein